MVIAHDSLKIGSIAKEYHAVALVGNAVKWCDSWTGDIDEIAQLQAEHLVALSENVSHDRVSQHSKRPDFQSWAGAYGAVRKIREEVRKILKKTVAEQSILRRAMPHPCLALISARKAHRQQSGPSRFGG